MRLAVGSLHAGQVVRRRVIYKSPVFGAYEEVVGQVDVRSAVLYAPLPSTRRCGRCRALRQEAFRRS